MKSYSTLIAGLLIAFLLSACGGSAAVTPSQAPSFDAIYTAAASTITAQAGPATPTMRLLPTATATVWASPTYSANTPTVQNVSLSYSTANGCYNAAYVSDVTIADGTELAPGEAFTKAWKFQNTGSCDWESDFVLTFETGTDMYGEDTTIDEAVAAGDTASLSVSLVAPDTEGTYTGYWRLSTDSGDAFGQSVYVMIVVTEDAATPTPTPTEEAATLTPTLTPIPTDIPTSTDVPTTIPAESPEATATPEAGS